MRDVEEIEHRCFPSPLQESGFHENIRTLVEVQHALGKSESLFDFLRQRWIRAVLFCSLDRALLFNKGYCATTIADTVARFGGSWTFIIFFAITLTVYASVNVILDKKAWDPYPFILLNLFLSMLAAVQAPVIMMSQNRQDAKDRLRSELDFEVNRRSETEIQGLARKVSLLDEKMDDLGELLRMGKSAEASGKDTKV